MALVPAHIPTEAGIVTVGVGLIETLIELVTTQKLATTVHVYAPPTLTDVVCVVAPFDQL